MSLNFILQGCITRRYSEKVNDKYSPAYEFSKIDEVDPQFIVGKDLNVIILKGVYLGEIKKNGINYYNLQFSGMLSGKNRVLDMYIRTEKEFFTIVREVDEMKPGKPAFLIKDYACCYGGAEGMLDKLISEYSADYKNTDEFFKYINFDKAKLPDTSFILGLNHDYASYLKSKIISNIYVKNNDGTFSAKRIISKEIEAYYNIELKYKIRDKRKMHRSKMMYGLTVMGDIVTSPFQLIAKIYIAIFGIW